MEIFASITICIALFFLLIDHHSSSTTVPCFVIPRYCLAPGIVIQFDPVMYTVTEGVSTMLRIVRVGNPDIPVSITISTVVGTAGDNFVYIDPQILIIDNKLMSCMYSIMALK